jgi:uncharacterized protein (TIGR00730 family)
MKCLCVFTGSSPGARPEYGEAAQALGQALVTRELGLVYGGGNVGLMGILADTVLEQGGHVIGVIPESLVRREVAHTGLSEQHVVGSMHERKAMMAELSSGFIALPGGIGTLEETFEILTWAQLGFHAKPCGLLDVCGYYTELLAFLDRSVEERFVKPEHRALLEVQTSPDAILDAFERYEPSSVTKWIDRT